MYTLQGKIRSTWHVRFPHQFIYVRCTLPAGSPRTWQPFMSHRQIWTDPSTPEKKGSRHNPQHVGWSIRGSVPSFSHKPINEAVDLSQTSIDDKLLGLLGPYHQHTIGTFNTYLWGSTHRFLTNTGGATALKALTFHISLPDLPNRWSSPFQLRVPFGLRLNKFYQLNQGLSLKGSITTTWSFGHSTIYRNLHLHLAIANDLSLALGFTRIDQNVT
jgi:hypothetical protein